MRRADTNNGSVFVVKGLDVVWIFSGEPDLGEIVLVMSVRVLPRATWLVSLT